MERYILGMTGKIEGCSGELDRRLISFIGLEKI